MCWQPPPRSLLLLLLLLLLLPAGLVGALLLFAAVATLESFTMYVLAKYAERYDAASYGSLIRRALGRKTGAGLSAVTVLYLWGSSVAYLVGFGVQG
jgi:sodium-coupled neutral amino acid transporter 7/8